MRGKDREGGLVCTHVTKKISLIFVLVKYVRHEDEKEVGRELEGKVVKVIG